MQLLPFTSAASNTYMYIADCHNLAFINDLSSSRPILGELVRPCFTLCLVHVQHNVRYVVSASQPGTRMSLQRQESTLQLWCVYCLCLQTQLSKLLALKQQKVQRLTNMNTEVEKMVCDSGSGVTHLCKCVNTCFYWIH